MHTKREKHNKKLWSYRLTCTSQNLLLLSRQILKGRRKKKWRGARCPTSTALHWELGFFVSCLSVSSFFFPPNLQWNANGNDFDRQLWKPEKVDRQGIPQAPGRVVLCRAAPPHHENPAGSWQAAPCQEMALFITGTSSATHPSSLGARCLFS